MKREKIKRGKRRSGEKKEGSKGKMGMKIGKGKE